MRSKELDATIALVTRMVESGGSGSVHEQQLRRALRELKTLRRGGKLDSERVFSIAKLLSEVLHDQFLRTTRV